MPPEQTSHAQQPEQRRQLEQQLQYPRAKYPQNRRTRRGGEQRAAASLEGRGGVKGGQLGLLRLIRLRLELLLWGDWKGVAVRGVGLLLARHGHVREAVLDRRHLSAAVLAQLARALAAAQPRGAGLLACASSAFIAFPPFP